MSHPELTARVTILSDGQPARQYFLDKEKLYRIGRSPECELRIDAAELSRLHASLCFTSEGWQILDRGSKNGTIVGGVRVDNAPLHHGAWVNIATVLIRFELLNDEQKTRSQTQADLLRQLTMSGRENISSASNVVDVLKKLMQSVLSVSSTQRSFAMLTQPDGDLEIACSQGTRGNQLGVEDFLGSRTVLNQTIATRSVVVISDTSRQATIARQASIVSSQTKALVCLPLTVLDRLVGVIYADSGEPGKIFTELDVSLLEEMAQHAAMLIATAQLGNELDQIDQQLLPTNITLHHLRPNRHRIPDPESQIPGVKDVAMTGIRWSQIAAPI